MDRPGGYEPSNARSTRAGDAVAVADLAMQRTVTPPYVGSNPTSHLQLSYCTKELRQKNCYMIYDITKISNLTFLFHKNCKTK